MSSHLSDVGRANLAYMTQRLDHRASWASWSNQMLRRRMPKINDAFAEHDPTRWTIGKIGALCRNLGGEAEGIRSASPCDLHLRPCLTSESLSDIVRSR
ncbi:hypothetical protein J2T08_005814 [Neorhizobium galegae]|nr:hypothetical protein [Neorhizobium galegae]